MGRFTVLLAPWTFIAQEFGSSLRWFCENNEMHKNDITFTPVYKSKDSL